MILQLPRRVFLSRCHQSGFELSESCLTVQLFYGQQGRCSSRISSSSPAFCPNLSEIVLSSLFNLVSMVQWVVLDFFSLSGSSVFDESLCLVICLLSLATLTYLAARSLLSRCLRCNGPCCVFVSVMMVFR